MGTVWQGIYLFLYQHFRSYSSRILNVLKNFIEGKSFRITRSSMRYSSTGTLNTLAETPHKSPRSTSVGSTVFISDLPLEDPVGDGLAGGTSSAIEGKVHWRHTHMVVNIGYSAVTGRIRAFLCPLCLLFSTSLHSWQCQ